nr:MAG TPA: hypothetical protein [Caudoviricetes sp.]
MPKLRVTCFQLCLGCIQQREYAFFYFFVHSYLVLISLQIYG